jgi:hypothetical protein
MYYFLKTLLNLVIITKDPQFYFLKNKTMSFCNKKIKIQIEFYPNHELTRQTLCSSKMKN